MEQVNSIYCKAPWTSLSLRNNNIVSVCANSGASFKVEQPAKLSELLTKENFQKYRLSHRKESPLQSCGVCNFRKGHGLWTLRDNHNALASKYNYQWTTDQILPEDILHLDINLSNVCNLKCRMCSFNRSSSWRQDQAELSRRLDFIKPPEEFQKNLIEVDVEAFTNLKVVVLKGGEPFFDKAAVSLLKKMVVAGYAKNISLTVFTNGVFVGQHLDVLKEFGAVNLFFSFEGTGKLYQYIRGGTHTFEEFKENVRLAAQLKNIHVRFMFTPQAYNIFNLPEAVDFVWNEMAPVLSRQMTEENLGSYFGNVLVEPDYLAISALPLNLRSQALQKIKSSSLSRLELWKNFESVLMQQGTDEQVAKFFRYSKKLDEIRNENLFHIVPELDQAEFRQLYHAEE